MFSGKVKELVMPEIETIENTPERENILSDASLLILQTYIESIEYGSVTIKIQDGKIVLIEKNEKIKIPRLPHENA
jgi:hypothetical protein